MSNIPVFNINHILFYVDGLDNSISDIVNIVFLLAKYHIHCCKWRDSRPCFEHFMNKFKLFYFYLRLLKKFGAPKISSDMSKFLVFYLLFFIFALHVLWIPLRFYTECYCIWFILCCYLYELLYSILFNKKKRKKRKKDTSDGHFAAYPIPKFTARQWRRDFYSNKIAGDGSVVADKYTSKCKYCVVI